MEEWVEKYKHEGEGEGEGERNMSTVMQKIRSINYIQIPIVLQIKLIEF